MKEAILITAYCPTFEKENILRNLIQSIDKKIYDICIVSHLPLPISIQKEVKYCFYDSENILVEDLDFKPITWSITPVGIIYHTQINRKAHILAIDKLISTGLSCLKALGYIKVHYIEYDTLILDNQIFEINSKDLDKHDCVFYLNPNLHPNAILGNYIAINLNLINPKFLKFNLEEKINFYKNSLIKMPEVIIHQALTKQNNYLKKQLSEIIPYIKLNLSDNNWETNGYVSIIPYYHDDKFHIFIKNSTLNESEIKININGKLNTYKIPSDVWVINSYGKYDEVNQITAHVDSQLYFNFNLNEIGKNKFKLRHYIEFKK